MAQNNLLLAYYGDDFTGSTDALEFLSRAGIKTVLFISPPTPQQLSAYNGLQAIGVAGMTRAMPPAEMEQTLRPAFMALRNLNPKHVHYKVCSTFDSSPHIGSIGKAIDVGAEVFQNRITPLLVAAPALGRYCTFGNLYARMGIGSAGQIYRLDRHPSMSKHPVTPAHESDLRAHLSLQTSKKTGLIDILQIEDEIADTAKKITALTDDGCEVVLFDALYPDQMPVIGELIDGLAEDKPLFSAGSSGIEMALGSYWNTEDLFKSQTRWNIPGEAGPILVLSGSCSPVTSGQISWALEHGFTGIALDTAAIAGNENIEIDDDISRANALLAEGKSVIIHTSRGNHDERIPATHAALSAKGLSPQQINAETSRLYGTALGRIVREVAAQGIVKRILIAGGDTSSYAARAMGIEAVEMIAPLAPGAPLCKAYAPGSPIDGLEVNFKGGQVGAEDYFEAVLQGTTATKHKKKQKA
ncbi:MAG: four-carbon acid sugar kinase family protein [Mucilaginibacter sp.]